MNIGCNLWPHHLLDALDQEIQIKCTSSLLDIATHYYLGLQYHNLPWPILHYAFESHTNTCKAILITLRRNFNRILRTIVEPILVGIVYHLINITMLIGKGMVVNGCGNFGQSKETSAQHTWCM